MILLGERSSQTSAELGGIAPEVTRVSYGAVWSGRIHKNDTYAMGASNGDEVTTDAAVLGHNYGSNARRWGVNGTRSPEGIASSMHPAGANVVFSDGSTHFLSDNLAFTVLKDLMSMSDGRVVGDY